MRLIDETFRARLKRPVLTTCLCWRLARRDGESLQLTDHDQPVEWQGAVYQPGAAMESGQFDHSPGLAPGRAAGKGALKADALTRADLDAGLWDGTRVSVYRVDWQVPEHGVLVWTGYLSEIVQKGEAFEAELVSLKADLEKPIGRIYSRRCDAELGDARCGLSGTDDQTCDKRFETCRDVFANTLNFRGFPHMPEPDVLLAGPPASGNDGGKR